MMERLLQGGPGGEPQARPDQALELAREGLPGQPTRRSPLGAQGAASGEPAPERLSTRRQGKELNDQVQPFRTTDLCVGG